HLGPGSSACEAGRSQGWPKGADRKAPWAPPGAPFPSYWRGKENRGRAHPAARKHWAGTAERWLSHTTCHSGRAKREPESITTIQGYGFRVRSLRSRPGMTKEKTERWLNDPRTSIAASACRAGSPKARRGGGSHRRLLHRAAPSRRRRRSPTSDGKTRAACW